MKEGPSEVGSSGSMVTHILAGREEAKPSFSKGFGGLLAPPDFSNLPTDLGLNELHFQKLFDWNSSIIISSNN